MDMFENSFVMCFYLLSTWENKWSFTICIFLKIMMSEHEPAQTHWWCVLSMCSDSVYHEEWLGCSFVIYNFLFHNTEYIFMHCAKVFVLDIYVERIGNFSLIPSTYAFGARLKEQPKIISSSLMNFVQKSCIAKRLQRQYIWFSFSYFTLVTSTGKSWIHSILEHWGYVQSVRYLVLHLPSWIILHYMVMSRHFINFSPSYVFNWNTKVNLPHSFDFVTIFCAIAHKSVVETLAC